MLIPRVPISIYQETHHMGVLGVLVFVVGILSGPTKLETRTQWIACISWTSPMSTTNLGSETRSPLLYFRRKTMKTRSRNLFRERLRTATL